MRPEVKFLLLCLVLLIALEGCTLLGKQAPRTAGVPQQRLLLDQALEALGGNRMQQARELLEQITEAAPLAGVTDEALFRLALLYLGDEGTVKAGARAEALLERLKKEFPNSPWSLQSKPLLSYMAGIKSLRDQRRQLKTLQDLNLSLGRENRELRQSLERLKQLDLELEQKIKR
ncbi:MAG TPA: tetratricopeptide repeat protein [Desulfuromonadaceae bacterium]